MPIYLPQDIGEFAVADEGSGVFKVYQRTGSDNQDVTTGMTVVYGSSETDVDDVNFGIRFIYDKGSQNFADLYYTTNNYIEINGSERIFITGAEAGNTEYTTTSLIGGRMVYSGVDMSGGASSAQTLTMNFIMPSATITSLTMHVEYLLRTAPSTITATAAFATMVDGDYGYVSDFYGSEDSFVQVVDNPESAANDYWLKAFDVDIYSEFTNNIPTTFAT